MPATPRRQSLSVVFAQQVVALTSAVLIAGIASATGTGAISLPVDPST